MKDVVDFLNKFTDNVDELNFWLDILSNRETKQPEQPKNECSTCEFRTDYLYGCSSYYCIDCSFQDAGELRDDGRNGVYTVVDNRKWRGTINESNK